MDNITPNKVRVAGNFDSEKKINLSFLREYAGITNLGNRISEVNLTAKDGSKIKWRHLMDGEYLAESPFDRWSYTIDLTPLKDPKAAAHLSWMTANGGILFLDDLLPQTNGECAVSLQVKMTANGKVIPPDIDEDLTFPDRRKAVIPFQAMDCRLKNRILGKTLLIVAINGNWKFTDEDALKTASDIVQNYEQLFGSSGYRSLNVSLRPFPISVPVGNYEADTRGNNITIISSDMTFAAESLQRLHEQLRHEIFHLWIPNGVNLSGNYDWFYEGFALYQSLKTGVALNRIRFDDYLDTLSRAYDIDKRLGQKLSLIDVSKNRWAGDNNTRVYARGMLVAFLCDLALLEKSKGKRSVTDILRKLYEKHRPPSAETDGNTAVLSLLRSYTELTPIIDRNITGSESVDWSGLINAAGLKADSTIQTTALKVISKPSGRQKDLLDKLGYNNWRKLSSK